MTHYCCRAWYILTFTILEKVHKKHCCCFFGFSCITPIQRELILHDVLHCSSCQLTSCVAKELLHHLWMRPHVVVMTPHAPRPSAN